MEGSQARTIVVEKGLCFLSFGACCPHREFVQGRRSSGARNDLLILKETLETLLGSQKRQKDYLLCKLTYCIIKPFTVSSMRLKRSTLGHSVPEFGC